MTPPTFNGGDAPEHRPTYNYFTNLFFKKAMTGFRQMSYVELMFNQY